jgi:hypothetical protein
MTSYVRLISRIWDDGDSFDADPETSDRIDDANTNCETDEWSTAVIQAVEALRGHGCTTPSTTPGFHPDLWYSDPDGSYVDNITTGRRRENSGHLYGFSELEQRQIWQLVTGELLVT